MTVVNQSTLTNSMPKFIRDVLRENLIDTQSPVRTATEWIFKGSVESEFNPPIVFIDEIDPTWVTWNLIGSKFKGADVKMIIRVWAVKMADRDNLVSQIRNTLKDESKTDDTDSIRSKFLALKEIKEFNSSAVISTYQEPEKIKRVARLELKWRYYGA